MNDCSHNYMQSCVDSTRMICCKCGAVKGEMPMEHVVHYTPVEENSGMEIQNKCIAACGLLSKVSTSRKELVTCKKCKCTHVFRIFND